MTDKHKFEKTRKDLKAEPRKSHEIYFSHNNLFTTFFEEKKVVESFLKDYVPAEIVRDLDFSTLRMDKESFVDKRLGRHFSDILYHIRFQQDPAYVYFLFEHKSREKKKKRKLASFQIIKYMVHIWDRHLKWHKNEDKLPPIIPIVIYHGEEEWGVSTDFLSLFNVPPCMEEYIPKFHFELYDISHLPDEHIKGDVLLRILFLTFKYIFNPELSQKLRDIFRLLLELKDKRRGTEYLELLLRYLSSSAEYVSMEELRETAEEFFEEGGEIMPTIFQQIKKEIANKYKDELAEARNEAAKARERMANIARRLMEKGMDIDTIMEVTGIPREKLEKIDSTIH